MNAPQALNRRYDFVLIFDVKDGNPNGDPDAGNLPRLDAETGHGLMTDVALKRKVRNFVGLVKEQNERAPEIGEKRFEIYVREKAILNLQHERAYSALNLAAPQEEQAQAALELEANDSKKKKPAKDKRKGSADEVGLARQWMCQNFFDVRTFGAVMSTGDKNCGQVRGPVQLTFARSVEPIVALEHSISVCAARSADKPVEAQIGIQGRKHTVPYGVYVAHGFVSSFLSKQTGFDAHDLELLWQALGQMFEHDRSAARGMMATRGLYVFEHDSELGNAPAHTLFDRLHITPKEAGTVARSFDAYAVDFDGAALAIGEAVDAAPGVKLIRRF